MEPIKKKSSASTPPAEPTSASAPSTEEPKDPATGASTKGATLSGPPTSKEQTNPGEAAGILRGGRSTEDDASAAGIAAGDAKGATLSEPPAAASTDEASTDEAAPAAGRTEPVAEAKPVIDVPPADDEEPVADAEPVIRTQPTSTDVPTSTDELTVEAEPVVEAEPTSKAEPTSEPEEPAMADRAEAALPPDPFAAGAPPAPGAPAPIDEATAASAMRTDRARDEEPARATPEPVSLEADVPAVTSTSASLTGEAPKADTGKRAIAYLIDAAIVLVLSLIPFVGGLVGVAYFLVRDGLDVDFMRRRSLGKKVMKLRPVRVDGGPVDVEASFKRNWMFGLGALASPLAFIPFLGWLLLFLVIPVGLVIGLYEVYRVFTAPDGRRWGDDLAGTRVIEVDE